MTEQPKEFVVACDKAARDYDKEIRAFWYALKTRGRELILTSQELRCSIGLVDDYGPTLARMRRTGESYLHPGFHGPVK